MEISKKIQPWIKQTLFQGFPQVFLHIKWPKAWIVQSLTEAYRALFCIGLWAPGKGTQTFLHSDSSTIFVISSENGCRFCLLEKTSLFLTCLDCTIGIRIAVLGTGLQERAREGWARPVSLHVVTHSEGPPLRSDEAQPGWFCRPRCHIILHSTARTLGGLVLPHRGALWGRSQILGSH